MQLDTKLQPASEQRQASQQGPHFPLLQVSLREPLHLKLLWVGRNNPWKRACSSVHAAVRLETGV